MFSLRRFGKSTNQVIRSRLCVSQCLSTCSPSLYHGARRRYISSTPHKRKQPPSSSSQKSQKTKPKDKINYNPDSFSETPNSEHVNFKRVTANDLASLQEPPTRVKMLVRDFIEDSLYNPNYGYFPKQVNIFTATEPIDFSSLRNMVEFQEEVGMRYAQYGVDGKGPGRQIWHTPTELFKPWYGRAIAQCLVSEYLLKYFPYEDFSVYEIGGGNGTLAQDMLDFIQEEHPDVYERTRYHIVEISANLADLQRKKLNEKHPCVTVTNQSIFHWDRVEPAPCFFLAMEVIDNFAHDMIRYDLRTLEPYQCLVTVDENGDYSTLYTRVTDPLISSFLSLRRRLFHPPPLPRLLNLSPALRSFYTQLPFAPNLSQPEFIPTRLLSLLRTLRRYFPRHRLLLSDFSSLPDAIPGANAPVVQTRYQNTTVPCTTLFVKPGYFDIFFPTNFHRLRDMYEDVLSQPLSLLPNIPPGAPDSFSAVTLSEASSLSFNSRAAVSPSDSEDLHTTPRASPLSTLISPLSLGSGFFSSYHPKNRRTPTDGVTSSSGLPVGERKSSVFTHAEFMETYADLSKTRLKSGENPVVEYYKNVKFLF